MFGSKIYTTMDSTQKGLDVRPNPREPNPFKIKIALLR